MLQVRNRVFETNSSSTHSICISKKHVDILGGHIDFYLGHYGWTMRNVNSASYLYTAIMLLDEEKRDAYLAHLKKVLLDHNVTYTFEEPIFDMCGTYQYLTNGSIDHDDDLHYLVDALMNDEDMLMRYLFGDTDVWTGNDNEAEDDDMCMVANEYHFVKDKETGKFELKKTGNWDHPYYDPEHYDYFYKGN